MAKASKTFKIGECCKGGVITAEINGDKVDIIAKEWDISAGTRRSSNQSKAKEWDRLTTDVTGCNAERSMNDFLNDLTSSYYAGQVMEYIKSKAKVNAGYDWF